MAEHLLLSLLHGLGVRRIVSRVLPDLLRHKLATPDRSRDPIANVVELSSLVRERREALAGLGVHRRWRRILYDALGRELATLSPARRLEAAAEVVEWAGRTLLQREYAGHWVAVVVRLARVAARYPRETDRWPGLLPWSIQDERWGFHALETASMYLWHSALGYPEGRQSELHCAHYAVLFALGAVGQWRELQWYDGPLPPPDVLELTEAQKESIARNPEHVSSQRADWERVFHRLDRRVREELARKTQLTPG